VILVETNDPRRREPVEVGADALDREVERRRKHRSARGASCEEARDRQAFGVRERT
jgi:hypothetical protein